MPPLRPAVDRFEELLKWAEQRAAENGIVPPYLQEGFVAAAMWPTRESSSGAGSSTEALGVAETFDLPPLRGGMLGLGLGLGQQHDKERGEESDESSEKSDEFGGAP